MKVKQEKNSAIPSDETDDAVSPAPSDTRVARMLAEGITEEDIEETRFPTHYPEER